MDGIRQININAAYKMGMEKLLQRMHEARETKKRMKLLPKNSHKSRVEGTAKVFYYTLSRSTNFTAISSHLH